ncbi:2679_t:CDS:2, partial [Racocetra fulgida]
MTIDIKNWFQIAVENYNLKEIPYDDFGILKYVNRGAFGNVYCTSCNSIPSEKVAVKEIYITEDDDEKRIKMFLNEGGTLREYLKTAILSWEKKVELALQIVEGMSYLHNKMITHRDL